MMRKLNTKVAAWIAICLFISFADAASARGGQPTAAESLRQAVQATAAIAVVLDVKTGQVTAASQLHEAAVTRSVPGSVLKPFFLADALEHQRIQPQATVFCTRTLTIAGRNLACTHPQSEAALNAEQSLAYSCNRYFAELAKRFTPEQATTALRPYGLTEWKPPATTAATQLFVLGLDGIRITPLQLAGAYRKLALLLEQTPAAGRLQAVKLGLEDSVNYGMAHNAQVATLSISGKTGTASDPGQAWTHGWFAGFAPSKSPQVVVVIYLPHGNGADAAHLAQTFFRSYEGKLLR